MTPDELLTKKDLELFKQELFELLKPLKDTQALNQQKWLKSQDVRKLLKISSGTLQNLRINGTLSYNKVGSIFFYKTEDIEKMLAGDTKKKSEKEIISPAKSHTFSVTFLLKPSKNKARDFYIIYIRLTID
ncbi:helix-turn-helix domain-containing protein [Mucilaginibacter sp.]|uniref:helix-turn-helix domain-containing protein n=1 Tax=Mucilaginibacter sp. TaxID=1882438 RepID=UPI003D0B4BD3